MRGDELDAERHDLVPKKIGLKVNFLMREKLKYRRNACRMYRCTMFRNVYYLNTKSAPDNIMNPSSKIQLVALMLLSCPSEQAGNIQMKLFSDATLWFFPHALLFPFRGATT